MRQRHRREFKGSAPAKEFGAWLLAHGHRVSNVHYRVKRRGRAGRWERPSRAFSWADPRKWRVIWQAPSV